MWTVLVTLYSGLPQSAWKGLIDYETSAFNASWANVAPYLFFDEKQNTFKGPIYHVANQIVQKCCGPEVKLQLVSRQLSQRAVEEEIGSSDMALPVVKTALTMFHGTIDGYVFLPLMETTGKWLCFNTL